MIKDKKYPWPPQEKYWTVRDEYDRFPEELLEDFNRDFKEVRDLFEESIAPWNPLLLWEEGAPGYVPEYGQAQPKVALKVQPDGKDKWTVLTAPGGVFLWKATYEGIPIAQHFYDYGFNAAVLDYRVAAYPPSVSYRDGHRAIRYLRAHAKELGICPDKIAIMGFSAGGTLAGMVGTTFTYGNPDSNDIVERESSRPDAVIIGYGAFTYSSYPQPGVNYDREVERYRVTNSPHANVTVDTPPFFIWQGNDMDDGRNALLLAEQLTNYGVPVELHLFPSGPHGTTMTPGLENPHNEHWKEMCKEWLEQIEQNSWK